MGTTTMKKNLVSEETFVTSAIRKLRKDGYKGIHSVYSGFSEAFKEYFDLSKEEARARIDTLVAKGVIQSHFAKGGIMLYLKGDMPVSADNGNRAKNTITAILG